MKNIIEQLKSLFISREQKERLELARQQAEFARKEQEEKEKAERAIREQEKANAELARKEQKNREKAELANFMNEVEKKISEFEGRDENEIKLLRIILENNSALKDEKSKTALKTKNVPFYYSDY
ncbi:MAG: hypothetical protein H6559_15285 [Lewinellaceae bacterium]|nr:hypothetical protein [Lewinellaceae bacterium]